LAGVVGGAGVAESVMTIDPHKRTASPWRQLAMASIGEAANTITLNLSRIR
jgi:hypothetical protein